MCLSQLLTQPHPARFSLQQLESTERMLSIFPSVHSLQLYRDSATEPLTRQGQVDNPLVFLYCAYTTDRLVVLGLDRVMAVHKW